MRLKKNKLINYRDMHEDVPGHNEYLKTFFSFNKTQNNTVEMKKFLKFYDDVRAANKAGRVRRAAAASPKNQFDINDDDCERATYYCTDCKVIIVCIGIFAASPN